MCIGIASCHDPQENRNKLKSYATIIKRIEINSNLYSQNRSFVYRPTQFEVKMMVTGEEVGGSIDQALASLKNLLDSTCFATMKLSSGFDFLSKKLARA